jgi:F-type H+-transporting ATPase subunit b
MTVFFRIFGSIALGTALLAFVGSAWSADEKAEAEKGAAPAHAQDPHAEKHGAAHGAGHEAHIGAEGVSDDPAEFKSDLAIYSFLVFLLLLGLLSKFAWGPVTEGLERRESSVRQNIADAESARVKAEKMLAAHTEKLNKAQDEIRELMAEARRDAEHTKADIMAVAQKEAEATRQRAVQEIERARDQALDDLFAHMSRAVEQATEQVVGRSLTGADHDRLITEALNSVTPSKN